MTSLSRVSLHGVRDDDALAYNCAVADLLDLRVESQIAVAVLHRSRSACRRRFVVMDAGGAAGAHVVRVR
jgi:hypothetical protein